MMASTKVTLFVNAGGLRFLITQGQTIKSWSAVDLKPESIKNNVIIDEAEVAASIRQLLKSQQVRTKRIIVGISGLHCLSRPLLLPPVPKEVLGDVVTREAKKILPVPLNQVFLSWQPLPAPEGKTKVFLVAVPRNTVEALYKTLRKAGLQPTFLGVKPLLLAKLVKDAGNSIIVDAQDDEFDVVISSGGIPQPVRTVIFANQDASWAEKLTAIINDLERTVAFYNANNQQKPLLADVPIYVSGELWEGSVHQKDSTLTQAEIDRVLHLEILGKKTGRPVMPLPSPYALPNGFEPGGYLTNIALSLPRDNDSKSANLNALPLLYQPKKISLVNVLGLPVAIIFALVLAVLLLFTQNVKADNTLMQTRTEQQNKLLKQKITQRQDLTNNISWLQKQISSNQTEADKLTAAAGRLAQQTKRINTDLNVTMAMLPDTIAVERVTQTLSSIIINGQARTEREVLSYADNLISSKVFAAVEVTNMVRSGNDSIEFTLKGAHEGQQIAVSCLEIAVNSLQPTTNLIFIRYSKGMMTVSASPANIQDMITYMQLLEKSGRFTEITVSDLSESPSGRLVYVLSLKTGE